MPIVAPGIIDIVSGGLDPSTIGYFDKVMPMISGNPDLVSFAINSDAALFRIKDENAVSSWQSDQYDTPQETIDVDEIDPNDFFDGNLLLEKIGRTTHYTLGDLEAEVLGPEPVYYKLTVHYGPAESEDIQLPVSFGNFLKLRGRHGLDFSQPGDSGSLVVLKRRSDEKRFAFGLLFAAPSKGPTYVMPIRPILEYFGVELVSGHNL
jgi:hypothetical protein